MKKNKKLLLIFLGIAALLGSFFVLQSNDSSDAEIQKAYLAGNEPEKDEHVTPAPKSTKIPILTPDPDYVSQIESVPKVKGDIPERSYESFRDFPYENMDFADDETVAFLKDIYENIDFYGEFEMGDAALYDTYIEEYKKLVQNEVAFTIPETGKEYYLKEYDSLKVWGDEVFDPREFTYYLFDMDGDGAPELCIWNSSTYIFKYDADANKTVLWEKINSPWERIHGTLKLRWNWEGVRYTLCELDKEGELSMGVYFMTEAFYSNGNIAYLVTVPKYTDEKKQINITRAMKEQAYFCEEEQVYMFYITEEQYDELTEDFFKAEELSEENLKEVTYTYDDLFGKNDEKEIIESDEEKKKR